MTRPESHDESDRSDATVPFSLDASTGAQPPENASTEIRSADATPAADSAPEAPLPSHIGRYEVLREIARGGVGAVLEARDRELGREIAIKVLLDRHADDHDLRERLIEEAQISGQLEHPGIVPVHEMGLVDGERPFLTMKLIRGRTLAALLEDRSSPEDGLDELLDVFVKACQSVAYAHSRGVLHRDLKPLNLMVGAFGEVQVMDWGLAKVLPAREEMAAGTPKANRGSSDTQRVRDDAAPPQAQLQPSGADAPRDARLIRSLQGSIMGTPAYMAPEQARGELENLDQRCDVFGLGAILCEILTGTPPYTGATLTELLYQARHAETEDAFARLDACAADAELVAIARSCLAAAPGDRPADGLAVAELLTAYTSSLQARARRAELEAAEARASAVSERKARRRGLAIAAMLVLALLGGGVGYALVELDRRDAIRASERELTAALGRADLLLDQAKSSGRRQPVAWATVIESVERARAMLVDGVATDLSDRVTSLASAAANGLRNARWLERLEHLRSEAETAYDLAQLNKSYATLFAEIVGANVLGDELDVADAAKRLIRTGIPEQLARYLDDWARNLKEVSDGETRLFARVLTLAKAADPAPFRTRLRDALLEDDVSQLRRLVGADEMGSLSTRDLDLLASRLLAAKDVELAREVWQRAIAASPEDFWSNVGLAFAELARPRPHAGDALRWLSAAHTIRPNNGAVIEQMAKLLRARGDGAGARRLISNALLRSPQNPNLVSAMATQYRDEGNLDAAERYARRAVEIHGRTDNRMGLSEELGALGRILREQGAFEESVEVIERAIEAFPKNWMNLRRLGVTLMKAGRAEEAVEVTERLLAVERSAPHLYNYSLYLEQAGRDADSLAAADEAVRLAPDDSRFLYRLALLSTPAESVPLLVRALELAPSDDDYALLLFDKLSAAPELDRAQAARIYRALSRLPHPRSSALELTRLLAWSSAPERTTFTAAIERFDQGIREDTRYSLIGVPLLLLSGRHDEALELARQNSTTVPQSQQPPLRLALVEAAATWPESAPDDAAAQQISAVFELLGEEESDRCIRHFSAHLALRRGNLDAALAGFEAALDEDPTSVESWLGLQRALTAQRGEQAGRAALSERLDQAGANDALRARVLRGTDAARAARPTAVSPAAGAVVSSPRPKLVVKSGAFADASLKHTHSVWYLREQGGSFELTPTLVLPTDRHLTELALPAGLLRSDTSYEWRVEHYNLGSTESIRSEKASFRTGDLGYEAVAFDLTEVLDADVVADLGDEHNDSFDAEGALLICDGFNGRRGDDPSARGLPADRRVGVHQLAPYDRPNALQLRPDRLGQATLRLPGPSGAFVALRFLVSGANGKSRVPATLEFTDGEPQKVFLECGDWFENPSPRGRLTPRLTPVFDGMDRLRGGALDDANAAALHELLVALPVGRELVAVHLKPAAAQFESPKTRLHLFAVTGMRRQD